MAGALDVSENLMSLSHFSENDSVKTVLARRSWGSSRIPRDFDVEAIMFVVLGAVSERALQRIFPSLQRLYESFLIDQTKSVFVAVGLDNFKTDVFRVFLEERLPPSSKRREFVNKFTYVRADCTKGTELSKLPPSSGDRTLFFYSLPPSIRQDAVMRALNETPLMNSWTRLVLQGSDPQTYNVRDSTFLLSEEKLFRIDPFAGSDATRRLVALRFGNRILEPTWNRNHVRSVLFDFSLDVSASKAYPDETFLRDVFVDHIFSLIALVAMERPASRFGDDVRDAKAEVLKAIQTAKPERMVLGRSSINNHSHPTSTFATVVFDIDTNRWRGVPFICRVGKNMDRTRSEVKLLFRTAAGADALWRDQGAALKENELRIRVFPSESATLDLVSNVPGLDTQLKNQRSTLDFLSQAAPYVPDPFERLIYDAMRGRRANFVRKDALLEAFRAIEPALAHATSTTVVHLYSVGDRTGPLASDDLISRTVTGGSGPSSPSLSSLSAAASSSSPLKATSPQMQSIQTHVMHHHHRDCPWLANTDIGSEVWSHATDFSAAREMQLSLRLNFDQMRLLLLAFVREMDAGIKSRNKSECAEAPTIKMLETFVTKLPNGTEEGSFYGLDLGGTNFRVVRFELVRGQAAKKVQEVSYRIPDDCKHGSTSDVLFDFTADCVAQVAGGKGDDDGSSPAVFGFTFSFPTLQETLSTGRLITWTKGWTTHGVVNEEISGLFKAALVRKGIRGEVAALINDTVGTLAARARDNHDVRVGVILGTGTNAAFQDPSTGSVVNTEWGGFGSFYKVPALPMNVVDREIDKESPNPQEQLFEKMISGYYLGEICRRWLWRLYEAKELWQSATIRDDVAIGVRDAFSFDSRFTSDVEMDLSEGLDLIRDIEERVLGVAGSSVMDRLMVREVCRAVVERAARLTACAIAAVVHRINLPGTVVAVDGSLFEAHASFKQRLVRALDLLECHCALVLSKDGSGLGAALVAAAASRKD